MDPEEGVCVYVSTKRGRRCRMQASKGSAYCGEHLIHDLNPDAHIRKRIPCPLDSTHTVFEDLLHKHLKKCNVAKRVTPAGYSPGINQGDDHAPSAPPTPALTTYPTQQLDDLIRRVELACQGHMTSVKDEFLSHPSLSDDLSDPTNGAAALKHLTQQASMVGHLDKQGLLDTSRVSCYVEFGAGRGKLTRAIHQAVQYANASACESQSTLAHGSPAQSGVVASGGGGVQYVLVDRASCRRKVDGAHRAAKLIGATCHRLHMDIVDLDLLGVEAIRGCGLVGVGKHLCGAATDLALRCMISTLQRGAVVGRGQGTKVCGVAIALCCHHRCAWEQLVGQDFLTQRGFTRADFDLLSHMTSWATCGSRPPVRAEGAEVEERKKWGYVPHPNEGVGLKCKRLIDLARVHYLQENGLRTHLVHYVQKDTSLENVLLVATAD